MKTDAETIRTSTPRAANGASRRASGAKSFESQMRFIVYEDNRAQWRWSLVANRSNVLANSAKSYGRQQHALDAVHNIQASAAGAELSAPR